MLSKQVESLLSQLEAQNILRETNEALSLYNEILKTQVKDTERMMSEVLSANESESVGSQEQFAQEITRLMGELEEKETRCSDQHRRLSVLANEERELREKLHESEGTLAKSITELAECRQVVDSKKEEIDDLKGRLSVMTKELSDESGSSRGGSAGMSLRELRVFNRDVTKENEGLRAQVRALERSMEQILLSTGHAMYNEIHAENRKLRMQKRELESVVTQLQSSVSPSTSQLQQVDNVAKENGKLRSQLQDGKRAYADYRSTSETKIVDLEQKLEALQQENTRLKVDIHAATEGRREEGTVPPPGYDEPFVAPPP
jgi:epidermal growth factor receptor substrate 15